MWMFTGFGVLMPAARPAKYTPPNDPRTLQIRSRRRQDLDILRAMFMQGQLGPTLHTPDKDYEYRAYCKPEDFAWAVFEMIMKIDYTKFKPETDNFADNEHHAFLTSVWATYLNMISTKKHQAEYWDSVDKKWGEYDDKHTDYFSGSRNATYPHKSGNDKFSTATPPPLPAGSPFSGEGTKNVGVGWPSEQRSSGADRDSYEPEVWDLPVGKGEGSVLDEVDDVLNAHYDVVADIIRESESDKAHEEEMDGLAVRMSHANCEHGQSDVAKRRCLRRRRRSGVQAPA